MGKKGKNKESTGGGGGGTVGTSGASNSANPPNQSISSTSTSTPTQSTLNDDEQSPSDSSPPFIDLSCLISQVESVVSSLSSFQTYSNAQALSALEKEKGIEKEREVWEKEKKDLREELERLEVKVRLHGDNQKKGTTANGNGKGKGKQEEDVEENGFLKKIHRGIQVDFLPPLPSRPTSSLPSSSLASTSKSLSVDSSEPTLIPKTISDYQLLVSSLETRLSLSETSNLALDHRIAQILQEKESSWSEQREVLMRKGEMEKRELEKRLEQALKKVEGLEKERPAAVLRIGGELPVPLPPYLLRRELMKIGGNTKVDRTNRRQFRDPLNNPLALLPPRRRPTLN